MQITIFKDLYIALPDPWQPGHINKYLARCNPNFYGRPRHDWVAVLDDSYVAPADPQRNCRFKFYLIRLLFQCSYESDVMHLAYLQYFQRMRERDPETGMWIVQRTENHEIVPVSSIVRNVHLIPFFDSPTMLTDNPEYENGYSFDMYLVNSYSDRYATRNFA